MISTIPSVLDIPLDEHLDANDYTSRFIFGFDSMMDPGSDGDDEVGFFFGRETTDDALCDQHDNCVDKFLDTVFTAWKAANYPNTNIELETSRMESGHAVLFPSSLSESEKLKFIEELRELLTSTGACERHDWYP